MVKERKEIEPTKYETKIRDALKAVGLNCEKIDYFAWFEHQKEFEISVSMEISVFVRTAENGYTDKKKRDIKRYERHIADKMVLEFKKEDLREYEDKLRFVINYNANQGVLPTVYSRTVYYNPLFHPYNAGWVSLLEKNGYAEEIEQSRLVGIFSKTDGEQMIRRALTDLEIKMEIIKEWLEREVKVRVGELVKSMNTEQKEEK